LHSLGKKKTEALKYTRRLGKFCFFPIISAGLIRGVASLKPLSWI